jgi:hypothetical protein
MRTKLYATFALALVTAISASAASAQTRDRQARTQGAARPGQAPQRDPVEMMLRAKQELGLTDAQEKTLKEIREKLATQNDTLFTQVEQITGRDMRKVAGQGADAARGAARAKARRAQAGGQADSKLSDEDRKRVKDLMDQIQEHTRGALKEAREVLTAEQREKLQTLMRSGPARRSKAA